VQLISVAVYNWDGRVRPVDFRPGRLNVVTGASRTGKSALLDIVDFCLGRDEAPIPQTKVFQSVAWYGTLWQFDDGSRAFAGRPTFKPGKSSTSRAMLRLGGADMALPVFEELGENTDSATLRDQLGSRIGLQEARLSPAEGSTRSPFKVGLGQAAIFLLQTQSEIASKSLLFHRQGEDGMSASIRDSLPYFLGAVAGDHAEKHQQLRLARRTLRRAEIALDAARAEAADHDSQIQSLLGEAYATGLIDVDRAPTELAVTILQGALENRPQNELLDIDIQSQDRRTALNAERLTLRTELGYLLDQRAVLMETAVTDGGYDGAIAKQLQRLKSVHLLPPIDGHGADACPVCKQTLADSDPTATQLTNRLSDLTTELESLALAQPGRQKALAEITAEIQLNRDRLISVEGALEADDATTADSGRLVDSRRMQFVRGRIDATIGRLARRREVDMPTLVETVTAAKRRVAALERELDDDLARERLTSALITLGREMTVLAQELDLENSDQGVRLDLAKLTVVTDTPTGPVPLAGLGSGANWLGYHLATYLALHKTFVEGGRPVPRLLMLDQPTQVFYESKPTAARDRMSESGTPDDEDHTAVTRMFKLLDVFVKSLAPYFQIIVSDHAHLADDWFEAAVEHNWRGDALIPRDWIDK
jgi:hypothetical protein